MKLIYTVITENKNKEMTAIIMAHTCQFVIMSDNKV